MIIGIKNCQLELLIFVQVYRTIDQIFTLFRGYEWTKESKGINKKEA